MKNLVLVRKFSPIITFNHQSLLVNPEDTSNGMHAKVTSLDVDALLPPIEKSSKTKHVATHQTLEPIKIFFIAIQKSIIQNRN